ncbi:unnamed protein product [Penicillium salamii]|uniref:Uncharacterized protein n=1 Tax=Penicillium salamii TaxID=1612424 RepID=A0A9W4IVP1_9EURO|nr:unnamed protein product [Penicillium salamii]
MSIILEDHQPPSLTRLGPTWYHEIPFLPHGWETTNDHGSGSLKHAALKSLVRDQSALKPELFEHVPWCLAKYIWDALGRCNKQTMHMWKIMTIAYPKQFHELSRHYCLSAGSPKKPLGDYMNILNNDDFCWRAILTIATTYCSAADLTAIAKIKNLVALDVYNQPYTSKSTLDPMSVDHDGLPLQDGFVRGWIESNELQHLRVLRLYNQHEMTTSALRSLRDLPELQLVLAYECEKITKHIRKSGRPANGVGINVEGWSACRLDWLWDSERKAESLNHVMPLLHAYESSIQPAKNGETKSSSLSTKLPILEFKLPTIDHSKKEMLAIRSNYSSMSIVMFTRDPVRQRIEGERKQKRERERKGSGAPEGSHRPPKRAIMKDRGIDISKTLNEFF